MDDQRDDEDWGDSDTPWSRRAPREPTPGPRGPVERTPPPQGEPTRQAPRSPGPNHPPSHGPPANRPANPPTNPPAWTPPVAPWMPPPAVQVPDHQGLAITALVLSLCSILGLVPAAVAMIQSSMVNSRLRRGDVAGAQVASGRARLWSLAAIAVSVVIYAIAYASGSNA